MSEESNINAGESVEIKFNTLLEGCRELGKQIQSLGQRLFLIANSLDSLGPAESYPEGSAERSFAQLRDDADFCLSRAAFDLCHQAEMRAESSRSPDLVGDVVLRLMGNCDRCIRFIEIYYSMMGDDMEGTGQIAPESFPDQFLWDLAQRVEAFPKFAERYPLHLYFAARHLHGLPMMMSHHIDITSEFTRLAELLRVGTQHPLDVAPRAKRGGKTPAMSYLEPLVYRINTLREILTVEPKHEVAITAERINWLWTYSYSEKTSEDVIEVLRRVLNLPPLTKATAKSWSVQVIVPYILLTEGVASACTGEAFLKNIWNHRGVKSIATFRSRLERAVTEFLIRYSRDGDSGQTS